MDAEVCMQGVFGPELEVHRKRTASETSPSQIRRYTRTNPIERLSLVAARELQQASESTSKKDGTVHFDLRFRAMVPGDKVDVYLIMNIDNFVFS